MLISTIVSKAHALTYFKIGTADAKFIVNLVSEFSSVVSKEVIGLTPLRNTRFFPSIPESFRGINRECRRTSTTCTRS